MLSALGRQALGIIESGQLNLLRKHHRGGHDRTRKRSDSDLVDSRDPTDPSGFHATTQCKERRDALGLQHRRPDETPAPLRQGTSAGPGIGVEFFLLS